MICSGVIKMLVACVQVLGGNERVGMIDAIYTHSVII
ncbi:hypothetical protein EMIT091MI3_10511 [Kosakonia quasisacchari]